MHDSVTSIDLTTVYVFDPIPQ